MSREVKRQKLTERDGEDTPLTKELIAHAKLLEIEGLEFESSEERTKRDNFEPLEKLEIEEIKKITPKVVHTERIQEEENSMISSIELKKLHDSEANSSIYKGSNLSGISKSIELGKILPSNQDSPVSTHVFVKPMLEKPLKSPIPQAPQKKLLPLEQAIKAESIYDDDSQVNTPPQTTQKVYLPSKRLNMLDHSKKVYRGPAPNPPSDSTSQ